MAKTAKIVRLVMDEFHIYSFSRGAARHRPTPVVAAGIRGATTDQNLSCAQVRWEIVGYHGTVAISCVARDIACRDRLSVSNQDKYSFPSTSNSDCIDEM